MKLVNSPECSRCKCASRTALCDLYNCMALATLWVRHLGWRFMKLGGFEDISVSRTRCGAAECLSKGLHKRVMTKCTGYYGVCPSTFFSLLFYFKPLILYSCHLSYSIILHTHQNNVSQIVHFPVFYTILGGHHKNVKLEFYCIHNFTTAGHKVDIIVTPCIHNIPPPTPQQLVYSDTSSPWRVYITSAIPAPKHQKVVILHAQHITHHTVNNPHSLGIK
jgi:hypothetical protein